MYKKIKVMRIITRMNIGGPAIHAVLLNSGLDSDSYESRLVCGRCDEHEGDMTYLASEKGITLLTIPEMKRKVSFKSDSIAFFKLFNLMRKERPDIVHTHMAKAGTLGRLAATMLRVPVKIHTFHGHTFHSYFNSFSEKAFLLIEKILASQTDTIVAISERQREDIEMVFKIKSRHGFEVVPLGFNLQPFFDVASKRGLFKKELGLSKDVKVVGIVGRIAPIKNHKLFLRAISLIDDELKKNTRFVVVGGGKSQDDLAAYARELNIEDIVIFTGWRKNLADVYADLDVVALTSLNEGTPVSLIEAMASSRPVVATAVGGVPDLVQDGQTGLLVSPREALPLKEAMQTLLRDETLRERIGSAGRAHVHSKYSDKRLIKDIEALYEKALKKKGIKI